MNSIESANMPSDRFVSALSRYRGSEVVYYTANNRKVLTFATYKKQVSNVPAEDDMYTVVPPGMEFRPDLLSSKVYGTPDFWWKILEANDIKDVYDFKIGKNIRLPGNVY
jgi:hypothetical protein